jgi:catalase
VHAKGGGAFGIFEVTAATRSRVAAYWTKVRADLGAAVAASLNGN